MTPSTPFRWWVWLGSVPFLLCGGCIGFLFFDPANREPYETWYAIGPVQVLGGPDEVWVFAEKSVVIRIPGRFVEAPIRTNGHHQEVVVFDANGPKERIVIPEMGPTFHTNIGKVFRQADGFYLIQGQSMGYHRSMFRWSKDHFELMPLEESEAWLKKQGLDANKIPEFDPAIDKITEANGWKHLYGDKAQLLTHEGPFAWKDLRMKFKVERDAMTKYRIVSTDQDKPLELDVLAFDPARKQISRQESDEMFKDAVTGHRKR